MYEHYQQKCEASKCEPVKLSMYRRVFNEEFNISFHVPKKDQCNVCTQYHNAENEGSLTEDAKQNYIQHQERKNIAREEKAQLTKGYQSRIRKYILVHLISKLF